MQWVIYFISLHSLSSSTMSHTFITGYMKPKILRKTSRFYDTSKAHSP